MTVHDFKIRYGKLNPSRAKPTIATRHFLFFLPYSQVATHDSLWSMHPTLIIFLDTSLLGVGDVWQLWRISMEEGRLLQMF